MIAGVGTTTAWTLAAHAQADRVRRIGVLMPYTQDNPEDQQRVAAFQQADLLSDDGGDMCDETLQIRKLWLGKLLKRSIDGVIYNDHDTGAIGPRLFEQACKMGLEGIVSKHRERSYKAGPSRHWIKVIRNRRQCFGLRMAIGRASLICSLPFSKH
jgi:ATP-dependent DNA ligase